jgi:hypothetical protein
MDLKAAIITSHGGERMDRRGIAAEEVRRVLAQPDAVLPVRPGRVVAQAISGPYLLRVFVDVDRHPPEVVTVYRTSKIKKYRSLP